MNDAPVLALPGRRPEARTTAWVTVGVTVTLLAYVGAVVVPYLTGDGWDGLLWVAALMAVQLAPLVAVVAGVWSLHRLVRAGRGGRPRVAALAGVSVVLCTALAVLAWVSPGLPVISVMMD